ncbi:MAG: acetyl-CoA carboxylase biotin carboxyl carrier protein subunit [Acidobacteriota bacterium]|nr:acetyl-CoA carboxylase biotin carboxyl carrier protein subunit [Acidobacteriota bacterium]NLT33711.1 acetyl-CoA carboxylase biotin carboxyl carrier protein subunit [Acidobacteriota bacterium]
MKEQDKLGRIALENGVYETRLTRKFEKRRLFERQDPRIIKALIPGVVAEISAHKGQTVRRGDGLMTLEAMKMLNRITAPVPGTVKAVRVKAGEKVSKGQVLVELE